MNSNLLKVLPLAVVALIATSPLSHAAKMSPSQFNAGLKAKVGTKKNAAAYNACAKFFQKALGDKKNKKFADKYAKSCVKILKKTSTVKIQLQGKAANTMVKALLGGYFKGFKFNINDSRYNKALNIIMKFPKLSQKTAVNSQAIYNTIKTYFSRKGVSQSETYSYYLGIAAANRYPDPPLS